MQDMQTYVCCSDMTILCFVPTRSLCGSIGKWWLHMWIQTALISLCDLTVCPNARHAKIHLHAHTWPSCMLSTPGTQCAHLTFLKTTTLGVHHMLVCHIPLITVWFQCVHFAVQWEINQGKQWLSASTTCWCATFRQSHFKEYMFNDNNDSTLGVHHMLVCHIPLITIIHGLGPTELLRNIHTGTISLVPKIRKCENGDYVLYKNMFN